MRACLRDCLRMCLRVFKGAWKFSFPYSVNVFNVRIVKFMFSSFTRHICIDLTYFISHSVFHLFLRDSIGEWHSLYLIPIISWIQLPINLTLAHKHLLLIVAILFFALNFISLLLYLADSLVLFFLFGASRLVLWYRNFVFIITFPIKLSDFLIL